MNGIYFYRSICNRLIHAPASHNTTLLTGSVASPSRFQILQRQVAKSGYEMLMSSETNFSVDALQLGCLAPSFRLEKNSFPPSLDMAEIQPTFLIKGFFSKETLDLFFFGQFCLLMLGSAKYLVDYLRFIWWIIKSKISLENLNSGLDFSKHPKCFWDVFWISNVNLHLGNWFQKEPNNFRKIKSKLVLCL